MATSSSAAAPSQQPKAQDVKRAIKGTQFIDPQTGRPEIETVLAYAEPPPPPPRPKKVSTSKPLPWKAKDAAAKKSASAAQQLVQKTLWDALKPAVEPQGAQANETQSDQNVRLLKELPNGPISVTNRPANLGSVRVVQCEQPVPFSREIAPAVLAHTSVKPLGSNPPPPDGKKVVVPLPGRDPALDLISLKPKPLMPQTAAPAARSAAPELPVDIFGRALPQRPPKPPAAAVEPSAEEQRREYDHFKKVMGGDRKLLVEIARAKAQHRDVVDKTLADDEVDIFGKPLKGPKVPVAAARQSMFPGDSKPIEIFGGSAKPGELPATTLYEKSRAELRRFPDYIQNPPQSHYPTIEKKDAPGTAVGQAKSGSPAAALPGKDGAPKNDPFAIPGLGKPEPTVPEGFYSSSVYRKILLGCGHWGLRALRLSLRAMDRDNDGILLRKEFLNACLKCSVDLTDPELTVLMQIGQPKLVTPEGKPSLLPARQENPQSILIPAILDALRGGDLPPKRRLLLQRAFRNLCQLAKKPTFSLTLEDIMNTTDFSAHPAFAPHVKGSMREITNSFSAAWPESKTRTSVVSEDEFISFYHDFSPTLRNDADFWRVIKGLHSLDA